MDGIKSGGFYGSSGTLTSTANQEIIPQPTVSSNSWGGTIYTTIKTPLKNSISETDVNFYEFYFCALQDCHVKINGSDPIFLPASTKYGDWNFTIDKNNTMINSFVIVDAGKNYCWMGAYR